MSRIWVGMEGRPHISTNNATFVLIQNSPSTPYSSGVQICTMNCIESFDKVNRKSGKKLVEGEFRENERRHWKKNP